VSSICGGQRAVLGRDVIGGAIGARGWFPGILFAASEIFSRVQRTVWFHLPCTGREK